MISPARRRNCNQAPVAARFLYSQAVQNMLNTSTKGQA